MKVRVYTPLFAFIHAAVAYIPSLPLQLLLYLHKSPCLCRHTSASLHILWYIQCRYIPRLLSFFFSFGHFYHCICNWRFVVKKITILCLIERYIRFWSSLILNFTSALNISSANLTIYCNLDFVTIIIAAHFTVYCVQFNNSYQCSLIWSIHQELVHCIYHHNSCDYKSVTRFSYEVYLVQ